MKLAIKSGVESREICVWKQKGIGITKIKTQRIIYLSDFISSSISNEEGCLLCFWVVKKKVDINQELKIYQMGTKIEVKIKAVIETKYHQSQGWMGKKVNMVRDTGSKWAAQEPL